MRTMIIVITGASKYITKGEKFIKARPFLNIVSIGSCAAYKKNVKFCNSFNLADLYRTEKSYEYHKEINPTKIINLFKILFMLCI